jgi:Mg2+-importing ATPase
MLIMQTVFFLVLFIFLVGILGHHQPFETVLFAISLAVGLTPEFLPMITTVTLGQGALRMAKQKVIVKHLESIQNFGSIDITGYSKVGEIPFDFERRCLSVIVRHEDELLLITKGAPESILPLCCAYEVNGERKALDGEVHTTFVQRYQDLCSQGYRVLAVAYRPIPQQTTYRKTDEQMLVLLGFLTFVDPPKPEAAKVVQALKSDGVQVKILTGDNELVTRHVCEQVGLDGSRIVLGSDLDHMSDTALSQVVEQVNVFARVSPAQKNRIILALKHRKHV